MEESWEPPRRTTTGTPPIRILLTPRITLEHADGLLDESQLPGRQGRLAFAFLVLERHRPVTKGEIADVLWPDELPPSWEVSLSAVVSKIRAFLAKAALGPDALVSAVGCYQLRLPSTAFVDVEAAMDGLHTLETLVRNGSNDEAWGASHVPYYISRRPFAVGADGPWVDRIRNRLNDIFLRTVDLRSEIYLWNAELDIAAVMAEEALVIDPYRESAYRTLMRAALAGGRRADAVRAYQRCRDLFASDLGIEPSAETTALLDEARSVS